VIAEGILWTVAALAFALATGTLGGLGGVALFWLLFFLAAGVVSLLIAAAQCALAASGRLVDRISSIVYAMRAMRRPSAWWGEGAL
jgi:hypothetical protein